MTTIRDVARMAGVGIGTASRVINNHPSVRPETRERVMRAVEELQFRPSQIARSMISKRTGAVGVIVPFFTRYFQITVLQGVQEVLSQAGKELVLYNVENDGQREHYFSDLSLFQRVDGLLVVSLTPPDAFARRCREKNMPTILVDAYNPFLTSLVVDNMEGGYLATRLLIDKGHQRIGFINGIIEGNFKFNQANDRLIGFHRAMSEAQLLFDPNLVVSCAWNRHEGKRMAQQLLTLPEPPTAILTGSDIQAVGVLEATREMGICVPEQLSVMGYDGIELAELLGLSTIQQPMQQMGEMGMQRLLEQMEQPQREAELIRLKPTLIERTTTASPVQ
jgi:LacI family transcriptional regulator